MTWISILVLLLCLAGIPVSVRIDLLHGHRVLPWLSAALRVCAAVSVFLLLFRCVESIRTPRDAERTVVFLRDVSGSMDAFSPDTKRTLSVMSERVETFLKTRPGSARIDFASEPASPENPAPHPGATALGDALLETAKRHPGAAVILLSDGASNSGVSPSAAADAVAQTGLSVHPLFPDGFHTAICEDMILSGASMTFNHVFSQTVFRALVVASGLGDRSVNAELVLSIDGREVHRMPLTVHSGIAPVYCALPESVKSTPGWHEFRAELVSPEKELFLFNNQAEGVFEVPPDDLALFLRKSSASPDSNALLSVFRSRYPNFQSFDAADWAAIPPDRRAALAQRAKVLLLFDFPAASVGDDVLGILAKRIREKSCSALFLSPKSAELFLNARGFAELLPVSGPPVYVNSKRKLQMTLPGEEFKKAVFPVWNYASFPRKRNTSVSVGASDPQNGLIPMVLTNEYCAVFAFTGSWRWKLSPDRASALLFEPAWTSLAEATDRFGSGSFRLNVRKAFQGDESDLFLFQLAGPKQDALDSVVLFEAPNDGDPVRRSDMRRSDNVFQTALPVRSPGIHWFYAEVSSGEKSIRSTRVPVRIEPEEPELRSLSDPESVLRPLASLSGGSLLSENDSGQLERVLPLSGGRTFLSDAKYDPSGTLPRWLAACAVLFFLSIDWLIRKLLEVKNARF